MRPSDDAVLMMLPPPERSMTGIAARQAVKIAVRFVAIVRSHCSSVQSTRRPDICTAALLYSTWTAPNAASVSSTMRSTSARTDTSAWTATAVPPSLRTSSTVSWAPSLLMSTTAMRAPWAAKSCAADRPCPDPAPVMRATRPSRSALHRRSAAVAPIASVLEFDDDLVERLLADVDRDIETTAVGPQHVAGRNVALDVPERAPWAPGVGLEVGGDPVAGDLDHDVVVVVAVQRSPLTGIEPHLPDPDAVVLHQQLGRDVAEYPCFPHGRRLYRGGSMWAHALRSGRHRHPLPARVLPRQRRVRA